MLILIGTYKPHFYFSKNVSSRIKGLYVIYIKEKGFVRSNSLGLFF